MGTVPYSNPGGMNQTAPPLRPTSSLGMGGATVPSAPPLPGGTPTSPSNPYIFSGGPGGGIPGATGTPATSTVPGTTPADPTAASLYGQWSDILGGTGKELFGFMQGMQGTSSDIFKQWLQSMQPQYAAAENQRAQSLRAGGVSPNSTVNALGSANLQAQELAQQGGVNAQLMQTNQQDTMSILQNMQDLAARQQASESGWGVFGNIMNAVGPLLGALIPGAGAAGAGMGMLSKLFTGGGGGGGVPGGGGFMPSSLPQETNLPTAFSTYNNVFSPAPVGVPVGDSGGSFAGG